MLPPGSEQTQKTKANIQEFIRNASLEITPGLRKKVGSFSDVMNPGRRVFVTYLPGAKPEGVIKTCIELRKDGMEPVPHLAARSITGPDQLHEILERLRQEADVRDVLLIGGSMDKPVGEYTSTIEMLQTGYFEEFGLRNIGVAGHPEGNPDIPEDKIREALQFKNQYAREHNVHLYIVTQFLFDYDPIFNWLDKIDSWGNQLPVNIGLPGPASLNTLIKYAKMCGVNTSFKFFRKQGFRLFKLASVSMPDFLVAALADYYAKTPNCPITRLHFFNFGGIEKTMRFMRSVENGEFDVKTLGHGFSLHQKL